MHKKKKGYRLSRRGSSRLATGSVRCCSQSSARVYVKKKTFFLGGEREREEGEVVWFFIFKLKNKKKKKHPRSVKEFVSQPNNPMLQMLGLQPPRKKK